MQSAIYLLGQRKEVSEIFENNIEPYLLEKRILIPDRTLIPLESFDQGLLFSLIGENLEQGLSEGVLNAFEKAKDNLPQLAIPQVETNWEYTLGLVKSEYSQGHGPFDKDHRKVWTPVYQRIGGPYSEELAASKFFVPIGLKYVLEGVDKKLSQLEDRMTELASTTLADFAKR